MPIPIIYSRRLFLITVLFIAACGTRAAIAADNPFPGDWALTIPGGSAGWLGIEDQGGKLSAQIMWGSGSVLPVDGVKLDGQTLILTRTQQSRRGGKVTETITARRTGDSLALTTVKKREDGSEFAKANFTGKLQPAMPPAPDLSKVKFGPAIQLFNGKNLDGWRLTDSKEDNGWVARDGLLVNDQSQPGKHYGNLRTDREFEDFTLSLEANVAKGGNSGVYIRGIYEVQVADTYGRKLDPHNFGAIYSRITPTESAEKPAGQWQTLEITFVDRHATVILNGKKIIDNQPVRGCTGGALWADVTRPGPIYLQGDHTGIEYRNIVLRPVVK
jgi:3-keto-disaccharide hydrolase